MSLLQTELSRLFLVPRSAADDGGEAGHRGVRCLVLQLAGPPDWRVLGRVWQGVQAELHLPAPAIAVSGRDGLQLWFSLMRPVSTVRGRAFLEGLHTRFLADIDPRRLQRFPGPAGQPESPPAVPALQTGTGNWSAFISQDLAPVFEDTPWLDIPPGDDNQAALLRSVKSIAATDFDDALKQLAPPADAPVSGTPAVPVPARAVATAPDAGPSSGGDARLFLQRVMDDDTVALVLRIEAAKALLQAP